MCSERGDLSPDVLGSLAFPAAQLLCHTARSLDWRSRGAAPQAMTETRGNKEDASLSRKMVSIVSYSLCSSTMLVINKLAVHYFPVPNLVRCA